METEQKPKLLLRSAEEILEPFIESGHVHSLDPYQVYERFKNVALLAILQAQQEALQAVEGLALKAFENIKNKLDETV